MISIEIFEFGGGSDPGPLPGLTPICPAPYRDNRSLHRVVNRISMHILPLNKIPAFLGIGGVAPGHLLDPENTIREPAKRSELKAPQKTRDRVALVPGQAEAVPEFLHRDPPLAGVLFLHEPVQQFRDPVVSSHGHGCCAVQTRAGSDSISRTRCSITESTARQVGESACRRI